MSAVEVKNVLPTPDPRPLSEAGSKRPLLIGEVLFDCFPNGRAVIGGAPFNVAWNLAGFGCDPLFISAVGDDTLGREVIDRMEQWGMDQTGLAVLPAFPTGRVDVHNAETEPEYHFQEDCAWDHVRLEPVAFAADHHGLIYHGSLAARKAVSREAIEKLRSEPTLPAFVDLNLRPPFYEEATVLELARGAHWLKLNAAELRLLGQLLAVPGDDLVEQSRAVGRALEVPHLLVTDGKAGAYWISEDEEALFEPALKAAHFVDSVGAGDAFASIAITGILHGWAPHRILQRAVIFAARVCEIQGATTSERKFYDEAFNNWK